MLDNNQWLGLGVIAGIAYLVDNEYRGGKEYGAESFEAEVCPCGCAMKGCVCSSSCKGECLGAESFGAEGRSFEVRDLEGNTYTLKQVSDVQLNEMKAFGDDRAYNKNIFFVDGMNGIAFYEGDRASWFGGLDYDEPKTTVIDEEGQKYDMWEKYLMEEIAEEKYMETGRGPYGFDDTNVYMTYFIMFLRDNNDEPINPQQFGFNAESFEAFDKDGNVIMDEAYYNWSQPCDMCDGGTLTQEGDENDLWVIISCDSCGFSQDVKMKEAESFEAEYTLTEMANKSFRDIDKISGFVADRLNHTQESWANLTPLERKEALNKIREDEDLDYLYDGGFDDGETTILTKKQLKKYLDKNYSSDDNIEIDDGYIAKYKNVWDIEYLIVEELDYDEDGYLKDAESFDAEERWYLSDPCYAIPDDRWDEFIHLVFANPNYDRNERMNIEWEVDGEDYIVEVWDSPGGDGVWRFSVGEFGVDAGLVSSYSRKGCNGRG